MNPVNMKKLRKLAKERLGKFVFLFSYIEIFVMQKILLSIAVCKNSREVFKARDKKTSKKFVAMKKVLMDNEKEGVSVKLLTIIKFKR